MVDDLLAVDLIGAEIGEVGRISADAGGPCRRPVDRRQVSSAG
jgi:hypothetical protein